MDDRTNFKPFKFIYKFLILFTYPALLCLVPVDVFAVFLLEQLPLLDAVMYKAIYN